MKTIVRTSSSLGTWLARCNFTLLSLAAVGSAFVTSAATFDPTRTAAARSVLQKVLRLLPRPAGQARPVCGRGAPPVCR